MSKHRRNRRKTRLAAPAAPMLLAPASLLLMLTLAAGPQPSWASAGPSPSPQQSPGAQPQPQQPQADPALRDYLSANGLLNRGMNELAVDEYRKFLAAHAEHEKAAVARYGLGVALFRLKKYDEAARELQPLVDRTRGGAFEFAAETLLIVGQSNFELKNYEEAAGPLSRLAGEFPRHDAADDAAAMAIEALYRTQRYDGIDALWNRFESDWPQSPLRERADYLRALALVSKKDDAAAAKHLEGMLKRFALGSDDAQFADRATLLRAQCLHRLGDLKSAGEAYRPLAGRDDDLGADATLGLALIAQQNNDEAAAAQQYDRFLEKWPEHASAPSAMIDRARIGIAQQQYDRARQMLEASLAKDQARADEAAYWLAKCDLRQDKFSEAATRLQQALGQYPESRLLAEMMYDRGVALAKASDGANAVSALNEFRRRFPEHALAADATYLQATLEHERRRYDASADLCAEFLRDHGDHAQAAAVAFLAAEDDMLRDRFEDAAKKYQAFLAQYPGDAQARTATYRLGSAQFRLQRYDEAAKSLTSVADGRKTEKPYRRALLMLGDIAFQQEQWEPALQLLSDYLSFGGEQDAADDARKRGGEQHLANGLRTGRAQREATVTHY